MRARACFRLVALLLVLSYGCGGLLVGHLNADDLKKVLTEVELSTELRQKLAAVQPATMGQAARIDGMTPAALTLVLAVSRRRPSRRHTERPMGRPSA